MTETKNSITFLLQWFAEKTSELSESDSHCLTVTP